MPLGCSNQWRTGDANISAEDMMALLNEVQSASTQSTGGGNLSSILAMKDDPNTTIYFGDAGPPQPNVLSVLAFDTLDFLASGQGYDWTNINSARVFFFDNPTGGHTDGLIIGILPNGAQQFQYFGFYGAGQIDSGTLTATLLGDNGNALIVRSDDVDGQTLTGTIQLRVYELDGGGNEVYIGKVPSLEGFH
jgi:hypothetical protein